MIEIVSERPGCLTTSPNSRRGGRCLLGWLRHSCKIGTQPCFQLLNLCGVLGAHLLAYLRNYLVFVHFRTRFPSRFWSIEYVLPAPVGTYAPYSTRVFWIPERYGQGVILPFDRPGTGIDLLLHLQL